jgi:hypothetical protein
MIGEKPRISISCFSKIKEEEDRAEGREGIGGRP